MKKIFMFLAAAAAVVSCAKNDVDTNVSVGGSDVESGFSTYATFTFKTEGTSSTRASLPTDGSDDQSKISDGKLLIFNAEGSKELAYIGDIVLNGTTTVATISGEKRIFIVANVGTGTEAATLLAGMSKDLSTLSDFYALMTNDKADDTNTDDAAELGTYFTEVTRTDNVLMSNGASSESKYTIYPEVTYLDSQANTDQAEYNNFTIVVKRAVAKAQLGVKASIIDLGTSEITTDDNIVKLKYSTMKYAMRNLNRSTNLTQQFESDETSDNDYAVTSTETDKTRPYAPYYNVFSALDTENLTTELFAQYYYDADFDIAINEGDFTYIPENSNDVTTVGNATYWGIEAEVSSLASAYVGASIALGNGDVDTKPVMERRYTITAAGDASSAATSISSTFYAVGVNQLTNGASIFIGASAFYFIDKDVAFTVLYHLLEMAGHIGTPANNNTAINDGVWDGNTIPSDCQTSGSLYFATVADFISGYDASLDAINTKLAAAAAAAEAAEEAWLPSSMDEVLYVYEDAKCYYRLNIFEKVGDEKFNLVRRNHAYSGTITNFAKLGLPTAGDLEANPGDPVDETETYVTADIKVQDWREVSVEGGV
ncbi:MAG: fimbria major subunit [Rikenellaceae bacterium]